MARSA